MWLDILDKTAALPGRSGGASWASWARKDLGWFSTLHIFSMATAHIIKTMNMISPSTAVISLSIVP